jgi:hypothetical protein
MLFQNNLIFWPKIIKFSAKKLQKGQQNQLTFYEMLINFVHMWDKVNTSRIFFSGIHLQQKLGFLKMNYF